MAHLGVVADDVTGATTTAALLASAGVDNVVVLDPAYVRGSEHGEREAVIVSTDSRALAPDEARRRVAEATRSLVDLGATLFTKRIDTTSRGGIGCEVEGMLSVLGDDHVAVFVPAMPQSRRIVIDGYSLIDSVLLARTGVATDVRTPVRESHLPTLLQGQLSMPLEHVGIRDVLSGHERLAERLTAIRGAGCRAILIDAASVEDVALIAQVLVDLRWKVLCVDPGPLTQAYALASGVARRERGEKPCLRLTAEADDSGTVMVLAGSATAVTQRQMQELDRTDGCVVLQVAVTPLVCGEGAFEAECRRVLEALDRALDRVGSTRVLVVGLESSLTGRLVDIDEIEREAGVTSGVGAASVAARFGRLGRLVMDRLGDRLTGVYLTGGDVMVSACRAMQAEGLALEGYVIPQADQGRIVGGPYAGLSVVGKGGLTGTPETAIHIVNRLFDERKSS